MGHYTFTLTPKDQALVLFSPDGDKFASTPKKIYVPKDRQGFATHISVHHYDGPTPDACTCDWKETEVWYSADAPQVLYISLASIDPPTGQPRFHMHDLRTNAPILRVEYKKNGDWEKHDLAWTLPASTSELRIVLNMKRKSGPFKVELIVMDTLRGTEINCDPLVGNDPD